MEQRQDTMPHADRARTLAWLYDGIERVMTEERLYLNPTVRITDLADMLGSNKTYVSVCINSYTGLTFHDYVNRLRVMEACRIIENEMRQGRRICVMDLCVRSGFNSMSTFCRAFSKHKGVKAKSYMLALCRNEGADEPVLRT